MNSISAMNDVESIWVRNIHGKPMSIDIETASGRSRTLQIRNTWIPQDLSLQVKAEYIKPAPDFRRAVMMNFLEILEDKDALAILKTEDAKKEVARLSNKPYSVEIPAIEEDFLTSKEQTNFNLVFSAMTSEEAESRVISIHMLNELTPNLVTKLKELQQDKGWDLGKHVNAKE